MSSERQWWWLAVNGSSVAASSYPLTAKELVVVPTPAVVIGYQTQEEQLDRQAFLLTAPTTELDKYSRELAAKVRQGDALCQKLPNPEPPTDGPTLWSNGPIPELDIY